jgi:hypothetical protein
MQVIDSKMAVRVGFGPLPLTENMELIDCVFL